jgi:hypothetical protein
MRIKEERIKQIGFIVASWLLGIDAHSHAAAILPGVDQAEKRHPLPERGESR